MTEDEKSPPPANPEQEARTVFIPSGKPLPQVPPQSSVTPPDGSTSVPPPTPEREEVTQPPTPGPIMPPPDASNSGGWDASPPSPPTVPPADPAAEASWDAPPAAPPPPVPLPPPAPSPSPTSYGDGLSTSFAPRADGKGIQVGDVLNHIFEVKRFIARGGMGEVFEGSNVNSDERVAIKVMLPALAADPNVISMFRKEARTLTKLQHEALVQYRVLAQEPQLGVLYIVTEYIDGTNLADVLGTIAATPDQLRMLLRRLASGLAAAHALGAIHRDISPDNVLLEDGKLARAKIIDFGIAKDLDPGSATIVGDGFAGKLNYVAPEQLGDFGRAVGPWTDVYSLGLVIMAVALGRNVQMGGSLVDAVDKRRAGPDLSDMPDEVRPVLEQMLRPNPAERLSSMEAVLAELDRSAAPPASVWTGADTEEGGSNRLLPIIGGVVALLVVLAAAGWYFMGGSKPAGSTAGGPAIAATDSRDPIEVSRSVVDATLPSVSCTWLQIVDVTKSDNGPLVKLTGVAGNPSEAQSEISQALAQRKILGANLDFEEVSPITQSGCAALDTYRQVRAPVSTRLSVPQRKFEMRMQPPGKAFAGLSAANAIVDIAIADPKADFALIGIEPSGVITVLEGSRAGFIAAVKQSDNGTPLADMGGDKYRMQLDLDHTGWSGLLLLTGQGPFPKTLIAPPLGARGPNWTDEFVKSAAAKGWQADMVWFKSVDEVKE